MKKMIPLNELVKKRAVWRERGKKVAFTNGCFDLLHAGHVRYLNSVRSMSDILIVGLNSDRSVRLLKGAERPVTPQEERAEVLLALNAVDEVVIFEELTPEILIKAIDPDILAKGGDWSPDRIVGADFVKNRGGQVVVVHPGPDTITCAIGDIEPFGHEDFAHVHSFPKQPICRGIVGSCAGGCRCVRRSRKRRRGDAWTDAIPIVSIEAEQLETAVPSTTTPASPRRT